MTVKASNHTGLAADDVFYFGSLVGETGDGGATGANSFRVSALDLAAVRRSLGRDATITNPLDVTHDGKITALDVAVVRQNLGRSLVRLTAPPAAQVVALPTPVFESDKTIRAAQATEDVLTS